MTGTTTNPPLRPAGRLSGLMPYSPPEPSPLVNLALDANEGNPNTNVVLETLRSITPEELRRYPNAGPLEAMIADRLGIDADRVVVTAGGDDALDRVCKSVLEPGRKMLWHTPSFEMIERWATLSGSEISEVPWLEGEFPTDAFIDSIDEQTALVVLVSPNNPTGSSIATDDVLRIARAAARVGALLLADLAYIEFDDADPSSSLLREPNIVIVRTFSKALGLAGMRVGYAAAPPAVARWMRTVGGPYPVSSTSLAIAAASLRDSQSGLEFIERIRDERTELSALLTELGCRPLPSNANFITARFSNAEFVYESLRSLGIGVRWFAGRPDLQDVVRITLPGVPADFQRVCQALRLILSPQYLCIDLDCLLPESTSIRFDRDLLRRLRERISLGIMSTHPREDTTKLLENAGLSDCFDSVLTVNTTDPRSPYEQLIDSDRAWVITDSAIGIADARRAGALALGSPPLSSNQANTARGLAAAGTARVLDTLEQIEELLP